MRNCKKYLKQKNIFLNKMFFVGLLKNKNMEKQNTYVGEAIRKHIKDNFLTNSYVIQAMKNVGFKMNDVKFSNKLYGKRDEFKQDEIEAISVILNKNF